MTPYYTKLFLNRLLTILFALIQAVVDNLLIILTDFFEDQGDNKLIVGYLHDK
jgi:hypothetical protein